MHHRVDPFPPVQYAQSLSMASVVHDIVVA